MWTGITCVECIGYTHYSTIVDWYFQNNRKILPWLVNYWRYFTENEDLPVYHGDILGIQYVDNGYIYIYNATMYNFHMGINQQWGYISFIWHRMGISYMNIYDIYMYKIMMIVEATIWSWWVCLGIEAVWSRPRGPRAWMVGCCWSLPMIPTEFSCRKLPSSAVGISVRIVN